MRERQNIKTGNDNMYLAHFRFQELPFVLAPDTEFFCHLKGYREALETILFSLRSGEGFIKVVGEPGAGKTLLCRKLLDSLEEDFFTAWIPNPDLSPLELRRALARELGINPGAITDQHELLNVISQRLLELASQGKKVVLLLDEAQAMPDESLEALRLLTNLETRSEKLIQIVLLGQPELDIRLNRPHFRQLKQRICFSCHLPALSRGELDVYLFHRLAVAGNPHLELFTRGARTKLYRASRGMPRLVNILCHKALLVAWGRGIQQITATVMNIAIEDTEAALLSHKTFLILLTSGLVLLTGLIFYWYSLKGIF